MPLKIQSQTASSRRGAYREERGLERETLSAVTHITVGEKQHIKLKKNSNNTKNLSFRA